MDLYAVPASVGELPPPRPDSVTFATVTADRLNVRMYPNTDAYIENVVLGGTGCLLIGQYRSWVYGNCEPDIWGWYASEFLDIENRGVLSQLDPAEPLLSWQQYAEEQANP